MKTLKGMALSVSAEEDERSEQECRKIKRVAHHTSEWRPSDMPDVR